MRWALVIIGCCFANAVDAQPCAYMNGVVTPTKGQGVMLVTRLKKPPRTRVTLSIDSDQGAHYEVIWDPAANDSLQHEVLLPPATTWTLTAQSAIERIASESKVFTFGTEFDAPEDMGADIQIKGTNFVQDAPNDPKRDTSGPTLSASCRPAQTDLARLVLNKRKVIAAARARGLFDQTIPAPVQATLSLLAEVAVERAKNGAMELVKEKFVTPVCEQLTFDLFGLTGGKGQLLPRTCTLVENMQLQDVLAGGRPLLNSVSDDIRQTFVPTLIANLPQLNDQVQTLAQLALKFASSAVDGQLDGIVEIDYLVALLDQLSWATGFDRNVGLVAKWVTGVVATDVYLGAVSNRLSADVEAGQVSGRAWNALAGCDLDKTTNRPDIERCSRAIAGSLADLKIQAWLGTFRDIRELVVEAALPESFDTPARIRGRAAWDDFAQCVTSDEDTTVRGAITWKRADRSACVKEIVRNLSNDWIESGIRRGIFSLDQVIATARSLSKSKFAEWLRVEWDSAVQDRFKKAKGASLEEVTLKYVRDELVRPLSGAQLTALDAACGFRLVVGIAKWCSSQESCGAGDVSAILSNPSRVFTVSRELPWALCWKTDTEYRTPARLDRYVDLGVRLVGFLNPPANGSEQQRVLSMINWMFDVVADLSTDPALVSRLHDIIKHVIKREYMSALSETISIAARFRSSRDFPLPAKRALQLIGAVGSYARVYEDTKNADASTARDARKRALETLIDAATDRRGRARDVVWSLGSNVGVSWSYLDEFQRDYFAPSDGEIGVRVPLAVAVQLLPLGSDSPNVSSDARYIGLHAGFQLADLGQFARTSDDAVTWKGFIAPGIELGLLFGYPNRTFTLTGHVSYSPEISDGAPPTWRYGVSFGYYVPFFDLN